MRFYDRLYGQIEFTDEELRLFQTPEFARLRQVSLSAIPVWTLPTGTCSSKGEHSIGVAHLSRVLTRANPEFMGQSRDLFCACLVHDIATGPFSHLSENFMLMILGKSHEEYAADVLEGTLLSREIMRYGASLDTVLGYVRGEGKPYGTLVSGVVDLDNLDNTLRYGLSLGIIPREAHFYNPEKLATGFTLHEGKIAINESVLGELSGWARCREATYQFTYSPDNLAPCAMLFRAMDLAYREDELLKSFFRLRDEEAYDYLENNCNRRTRALARRARRFQQHSLCYEFSSSDVTSAVSNFLKDSTTRIKVADEIAALLRREPEDIAVYAGQNRAYKELNLKIITDDGRVTTETPLLVMTPTWILHVYVREPERGDREKIEECASSMLAGQHATTAPYLKISD
jgi:HD superfamily phosphohydrolase